MRLGEGSCGRHHLATSGVADYPVNGQKEEREEEEGRRRKRTGTIVDEGQREP
jgi:hypothetical protein